MPTVCLEWAALHNKDKHRCARRHREKLFQATGRTFTEAQKLIWAGNPQDISSVSVKLACGVWAEDGMREGWRWWQREDHEGLYRSYKELRLFLDGKRSQGRVSSTRGAWRMIRGTQTKAIWLLLLLLCGHWPRRATWSREGPWLGYVA